MHLCSHSTGAILLARLLETMEDLAPTLRISSCTPVRASRLGRPVREPLLSVPGDAARHLRRRPDAVFNLNDRMERDDTVGGESYRKSLLYLVSTRSKKRCRGDRSVCRSTWIHCQKPKMQLRLPTASACITPMVRRPAITRAPPGGFDNDVASMNSLLRSIPAPARTQVQQGTPGLLRQRSRRWQFSEAFTQTAAHEGGYSNDPWTRGGETYRGIARVHHPDWAGWKRIDAQRRRRGFAKSLDGDESKSGGRAGVLQRPTGIVSTATCCPIRQLRTNCTIPPSTWACAARCASLQTSLNMLNRNQTDYEDLIVDGWFGAKTLHTLDAFVEEGPRRHRAGETDEHPAGRATSRSWLGIPARSALPVAGSKRA